MMQKAKMLVVAAAVFAGAVLCGSSFAQPAADPLTYPEITTALQTKLPNQVFKTKRQLLTFVIEQIKTRKIDKPLTKDREDDLRQAGATAELLRAIRANSPALVEEPAGPVDLGELSSRAVNLVKPDYTDEARRARTAGQVKLALDLDETGRVTSVTRLTVLPNGLTENAVAAARQSTFSPAMRDGRPARGTGVITYNFKINPIDVDATLAAANAFRSRRECEQAIREYGRILEFDARHAKALLGRGTCHLIEANYTLAEADLTNAAASDTNDPDIYFYLAIVQDFKGELAAAAGNYGTALKLRPDLDSQPTFRCLYIDRRSMTPDEARAAAPGIIESCNASFRGASDNLLSLLYYKRAIAYRLRSDFDRAIADLETVQRMNPQFAAVKTQLQIAYNARGLDAFNRKNFKEALDDVSRAISTDPQNPVPYINRCAIYLYGRKQYREAIDDCTAAIRLGTRSSTAYSHRGYAFEQNNSRAEAIADYKTALQIDPRNEAARARLNKLESSRPSMKNY